MIVLTANMPGQCVFSPVDGPLAPRTYARTHRMAYHISETGEVLLRGIGTLRYLFPPNASVQWQPDGLTIHTKSGS